MLFQQTRRISIVVLVTQSWLIGCAPSGYYYETGSFTPTARDVCARPNVSDGFVRALNAKVGTPDGPPNQIIALEGMASTNVVNNGAGGHLECRGTLIFANGKETGFISLSGGDSAGSKVTWVSEKEKSRLDTKAQEDALNVQNAQRIAEENRRNAKTPIEANAVLYEKSEKALGLIELASNIVREYGYRCDSISAARPTRLSRGFILTCNDFSYTYNLQDKGGHWMVTVD